MLRTHSGLTTFFLGVIASCNAGCTMAAGYISRLPLMPNGLNSIAGAIALREHRYGHSTLPGDCLANKQPRPPPQP